MKIQLTLNSFAALLYCSDLIPSNYPPLNNEEWIVVEKKLNESSNRDVSRLFGMNEEILTQIIGIDEYITKKIINRNTLMSNMFHSLYNLETESINVTTKYESNYPKALLSLKNRAPMILYYVGDLSLIKKENMSVVGPQSMNKRLIFLTKNAVTKIHDEGNSLIVSGLKGVDAYATKLMLNLGGNVVFFVADHMYDKIKTYEKEIKNKQVCILSAVDPFAYFNVTNSLDRNIYIAGLSKYQFVVATKINSGAVWFTSVQNLHFKWTKQLVMDIKSSNNGNLRLIEMGAVPVSDEDLLSLRTIDEIVEKNENTGDIDETVVDQMSIYEFIEE